LDIVAIAATGFGVFYLFFQETRAVSTKVTQDLQQSSPEFFADHAQIAPWRPAPRRFFTHLEYSARQRVAGMPAVK